MKTSAPDASSDPDAAAHAVDVAELDAKIAESMKAYNETKRVLLAVGPARGDTMGLVLKHYAGDVFVYAGHGACYLSSHGDANFFKQLEREWLLVRYIDTGVDKTKESGWRWLLPRWMNPSCKLKLDGIERCELVWMFRRRPIMQETKMTTTCCGKQVEKTVAKPLEERAQISDDEIWQTDRFRTFWNSRGTLKPPHMEPVA